MGAASRFTNRGASSATTGPAGSVRASHSRLSRRKRRSSLRPGRGQPLGEHPPGSREQLGLHRGGRGVTAGEPLDQHVEIVDLAQSVLQQPGEPALLVEGDAARLGVEVQHVAQPLERDPQIVQVGRLRRALRHRAVRRHPARQAVDHVGQVAGRHRLLGAAPHEPRMPGEVAQRALELRVAPAGQARRELLVRAPAPLLQGRQQVLEARRLDAVQVGEVPVLEQRDDDVEVAHPAQRARQPAQPGASGAPEGPHHRGEQRQRRPEPPRLHPHLVHGLGVVAAARRLLPAQQLAHLPGHDPARRLPRREGRRRRQGRAHVRALPRAP